MFLNPEEIIKSFNLNPAMVVADFGCGSGYYSLAAAKAVGHSGIVYAVDIQKNLLEAVKSAAEARHLNNIEIIWANIEGEKGCHLASGVADFVIVSNILFQAESKEKIAKEAFRILKDNGRAALIEWNSLAKFGPKQGMALAKEEAQKIFIKEGFKLEREFLAGENHYGLMFKKINYTR